MFRLTIEVDLERNLGGRAEKTPIIDLIEQLVKKRVKTEKTRNEPARRNHGRGASLNSPLGSQKKKQKKKQRV